MLPTGKWGDLPSCQGSASEGPKLDLLLGSALGLLSVCMWTFPMGAVTLLSARQ